ncbi:MAG: hypothetical protein ACRDTJ_29220 [Pseudonocardiaceae bacterium]
MPSNGQRPWIRVDGIPAESHAPVGEMKVEHRHPFGCWEAAWSMSLRPRQRLAGIVKGATVEVLLGSFPIWAGTLTELDRGDGRFVASGSARLAEHAPAMNTSGMTTTVPDTAIDRAITLGWLDWTRPTSISSAAYAGTDSSTVDGSDRLNTVAALLDAYTAENSLRWGVDAHRRVYATADPTAVMWDIRPTTQVLASASDRLAGTIVARWANSFGAKATTTTGSGLPVVPISLLERGALTSGRVTTISNAILARAASAAGAVGAFEIGADQIRGRPHLARIVAGQRVRLLGQYDPDSGVSTTPSIVLGITSWNVAERTVTCTPVDATARDLASIVAEQGGTLA